MKTCSKCKVDKLPSEYYKDKAFKDGHQAQCKECTKAITRSNARTTHGKEQRKGYTQTLNGRYTTYKASAKKRGISFDLSLDEFKTFWQADCSLCGDQIATIGIDRFDSSIGYTIDNCNPCCSMCNYIKNDYDNETLNTHMLKMLKHQKIIGA